MKLVIGLGNPGKRYEKSRHNIGFMVLDRLNAAGEWSESKKGRSLYHWTQIGGEKVEFIKPLTFMNQSGHAVSYVKRKHRDLDLKDLYVVHDDLDIKLGKYKIHKGKGPREHMGLLSIYKKLGTKDFWHVRVGVDNRQSDDGNRTTAISGEQYVLQDFSDEELKVIKIVINKVIEEIKVRVLD